MSVIDIITGLSGAVGPAGAEGSAARLAMELLSDYAPVRQNALGSVVAELGDIQSKNHILLDAHIDEIGMIVTDVDDDGFLRVDHTGAVDRRTLLGAEVIVLGRKRIAGIVCSVPPHLAHDKGGAAPEWHEVFIDIGCGADRARELVPVGSRIVVRSKPVKLMNSRIAGRALDDRAGVTALIRTVELLDQDSSKLPCRLTILLSVQEETGGVGAQTAAFTAEPTQAVAVDAGFARQPGAPCEQCGRLGKGPMIGYAPVLSRAITARLREIADHDEIPWQPDIMGGITGTNADNISLSRGGVRSGLVSIPVRNMHTAVEVADLADIENTAKLLTAFVRSGGVSVD